MSRNNTLEIPFDIGSAEVTLSIEYDFIRGYPATGPSYSCGGEPAEPPEVCINKIEWRERASCTEWNKASGALFDLIASDNLLYDQICNHEER
jgi:hypothetical protein